MVDSLLVDNEKLVREFGASRISDLKEIPNFYTFNNKLIYSHRDFDKFFSALKKGEKCAIVSGLNPSSSFHLGHKIVFDTNLYFQKKYNLPIFVPISDDESYVAGKIDTQKIGYENALILAKELLAFGFDPKKTYFIIDQVYTNIYNLAIKLSKKINYSEVKATYGYKPEENIGLHFYPAVQSAHIIFPQEKFGIKNVLVPIGPDEDAHLRVCRDVAPRMNYEKPAVLHLSFIPGIDGKKMSKSKDNSIFLKDDKKTIIKKINKSLSGGQKTIEEHRKIGGNPEIDISCQYLSKFFLDKIETKKLFEDYRRGNLLSGEVKKMLIDKLLKSSYDFQNNLENVKEEDIMKAILTNEKNFK